jgi:hypothetical protein
VQPILPELDIWLKAFSRRAPDPRIVHAFTRHVTDRRILTLGWIRQGLLARAADERQFVRLEWLISAYPEVQVLTTDHVQAARRTRSLRESGIALAPWQALLWTVAERIGGVIWCEDHRWQLLQRHGCPLLRS